MGIGAGDTFTILVGGSGTVSAGTLRVSLATDVALPAGTNAIGKLAANSGVDIGDVDVTSVNGFAAHDAGVAGNPLLVAYEAKDFDGAALPNAVNAEADVVRAAASLSGIQYVMVVNEDGSAVGTISVNSHAVTNAGTFAVQVDGDALTALQLIDDAVYVDDADWTDDTSKHLLVGGVYQATPHTVTDGDVSPFLVDANGRIVVVQGGTWDEVGINDSGNSITVDNAGLTELAAAINGSSQMDVNIAANGISLATSAKQDTMITSLSVLDDWDNGASDGASVSGDVAHDTADAGEPVKNGFKAVDIGTQPTAVANNDRSDWYGTRNGVAWTLGGSLATLTKELNVTDADGAQTDTALITVAAGTAIVVTAFQAMCDGANTGDVAYRVGFGTANTPAADAAGIISSHPGVKAGSGVVVGNGGGVIGMGASNEDLRLTCEDPAGGAINFIITYHTVLIG